MDLPFWLTQASSWSSAQTFLNVPPENSKVSTLLEDSKVGTFLDNSLKVGTL